MSRTEDRLRAALLETAEQVPRSAVPPLDLSAELPDRRRYTSRRAAGQPLRWPSALATAAAVCLIIAVSVTLAGRPREVAPTAPTGQLTQFPPYYVALQQAGRAFVGSTLTGNPLATIAVPKPYGKFAFVQGTADNREFILGAQRLTYAGTYPATKLYLLRLSPSARPGHRARLTGLAVPLLGGHGYELGWFALSPNGQLLAAISTTTATNNPTLLRVYDLLTGTSRTWVLPRWAQRYDSFQDVTGPPSWRTDSRTLAFFERTTAGAAELVLLDTRASGASFSAESQSVALPRPQGTDEISFGPDSPLLTPDGQHVLEQVIDLRELRARSGVFHAFALDVVDIRTGAVSELRQHSQIFYALASDSSGSAVIVAIANLPPLAEGLRVCTAHATTPIEVPVGTTAVAW